MSIRLLGPSIGKSTIGFCIPTQAINGTFGT